jgi:hypothetical protein
VSKWGPLFPSKWVPLIRRSLGPPTGALRWLNSLNRFTPCLCVISEFVSAGTLPWVLGP